MKFSGTRRTVTMQSNRIELTDDDVRALIRKAGHTIHPEARVQVEVPGGGDWSGLRLDIGSDANIIVSWEEST